MPAKKGGKGKKKGKKHIPGEREILTKGKVLSQLNNSVVSNENIMWYARVEKAYSGDRIQVTYYGDKDKTGTHKTDIVDVHVSKNLRRARPKKGDYLLIQPRPFNKSQYDAVLFYNAEDAKNLIKWKEIPLDTTASNIVFITNDEDEDDNKPLTKSQKRKLRLQHISKNRDQDYVNMDDLLSSGPGNKSIYNTFIEDDNEDGKKLLENAIADIKQKQDSQDTESSNEDSDEEVDVVVDVEDDFSDEENFI
jgi:hypothetical protein